MTRVYVMTYILQFVYYICYTRAYHGRHLEGQLPPSRLNLPPTSPKLQEVTAVGFPLFLSKFKRVITLASHLVIYCFFFFFFFFLWLRQGRSQGMLASDKKLIFKGSPALLELIFAPNFCWNTLLMWLQK